MEQKQARDNNHTQPVSNDRYSYDKNGCVLPSFPQRAEMVITAKSLNEEGYRHAQFIISLLHSYVQEYNLFPLKSKKDQQGVILLDNGQKFPIFYRFKNGHRYFSILKVDVELFNTFLCERMPNKATVPQKLICLDSEVPIFRDYINLDLGIADKKSRAICRIIKDACENGERISYDELLITIKSDKTKPELKLVAYKRIMIKETKQISCYALKKESIPEILKYFEFPLVKILVPQKGDVTLAGLNTIFEKQIPTKHKQFKMLKKELLKQIELEREKDSSKTTFSICLTYNQNCEYITVHIRRWLNDELLYAFDRDCIDKICKLIAGVAKLDIEKEIPITPTRASEFNNGDVEIDSNLLRVLGKEIKKCLQDNTRITIPFGNGDEITFFYRDYKSSKIVAILREDKDKLLDYIRQEICPKYQLSFVKKTELLEDDVVINFKNLQKIFNISESKAKVKNYELVKMCKSSFKLDGTDTEYTLTLPDGSCQSITLGKRSSGKGYGTYIFKQKDILTLQYYFGYISKKQYKELAKKQKEALVKNQKELERKRKEELVRKQEELERKQQEEFVRKQEELERKRKEELTERSKSVSKEVSEEITQHKKKIVLDNYYKRYDKSHNFVAQYFDRNFEIKKATYIFKEEIFPTFGSMSTIVPLPLDNLYITGSELGLLTLWHYKDKIFRSAWEYRLNAAMVRDIGALKDKLIVLHDKGIKIFTKKEGTFGYYQSQELQLGIIPECFVAFSNTFGQNIIYVYLPNKIVAVYKAEKGFPFKYIGKITNLPIESKGRVKKIIPLSNRRFLMFFDTGEIYNLPLKEQISSDDIIFKETLDEKIRCVSNLSNDLLFIITKDKVGHLYRFNESFSAMHEEYSLILKLGLKNKKVLSVFLRDNDCYINTTHNYGFNGDMFKLTLHY